MDEQNLDPPPLSTDTQLHSNQTSSGLVSGTKSDQPSASQVSEEKFDQPIPSPELSDRPTSNPESQQNSEQPVSGVTSDHQKVTPVSEPNSKQPISDINSESKSEQPTQRQVSKETSNQPISKVVSEPKSDHPAANHVSGKISNEPSSPKSAQPPPYSSIFAQLKDVRATSGGNVMAVKKSFSIISASMGCRILLAIILAVPVSMMVIGSIYLNDCPVERNIPIYLIVGGCFTIISNTISLIQKYRSSGTDDEESSGRDNEQSTGFSISCRMTGLPAACYTIICFFLFVWFICGNVWIYKTYRNFSTNVTDPNYCHPTLLYYSFWLLTVSYILVGLSCLVGCCGSIIMCCCAS